MQNAAPTGNDRHESCTNLLAGELACTMFVAGFIFGMKNDFTSIRILNTLFCKIGKRAVAEKDNLVLLSFIHRRIIQDYF